MIRKLLNDMLTFLKSEAITSNLQNITSIFFNITIITFMILWSLSLVSHLNNPRIVNGSDYIAFYTAGTLIKNDQAKNLYDIKSQNTIQEKVLDNNQEDFLPFRYLPFVALIFYPFSFFSYANAFILFLITNLSFIVIFLLLAKTTFKSVAKHRLWFLLPLAYYPIMLSLVKGQVTIFILIIVSLFYKLLRTKPLLSGIIYSLLLIKPHFFVTGILFFLLLAKRKKELVAGIIIGTTIIIIFSLFTTGLKLLLQFPHYTLLKEQTVYGNIPEWKLNLNLSLLITPFVKSVGGNLIHIYAAQLGVYFLVLFSFYKKVRMLVYENGFIAATIFMLILSLHTYPYDYALILLPIYLILENALNKKIWNKSAVFAVILLYFLPTVVVAGSSFLNPILLLYLGFKHSKIV